MIVGHHVVFGAYGFWLPNDPRGSWSDFVGSWELFRYGVARKITETRSTAHIEHDRALRLAAKKALKYPPVVFTGIQTRAIAAGFANYIESSGIRIWACAIMPDHVHLVLAQDKRKVEQVVIQLKGAATEKLIEEGIHPFQNILVHPKSDKTARRPKCFSRGEWKSYLDVEDVPLAVCYVENNPVKEGKPQQSWSFVTPLD